MQDFRFQRGVLFATSPTSRAIIAVAMLLPFGAAWRTIYCEETSPRQASLVRIVVEESVGWRVETYVLRMNQWHRESSRQLDAVGVQRLTPIVDKLRSQIDLPKFGDGEAPVAPEAANENAASTRIAIVDLTPNRRRTISFTVEYARRMGLLNESATILSMVGTKDAK